jgi:type II secretory pathway component PulF
MPYYKDTQSMYTQPNQQRVTPLTHEMYNQQQHFQTAQDDANPIIPFLKQYWWAIVLVVVLIFVFYFWYGSSKSGERIVEF